MVNRVILLTMEGEREKVDPFRGTKIILLFLILKFFPSKLETDFPETIFHSFSLSFHLFSSSFSFLHRLTKWMAQHFSSVEFLMWILLTLLLYMRFHKYATMNSKLAPNGNRRRSEIDVEEIRAKDGVENEAWKRGTSLMSLFPHIIMIMKKIISVKMRAILAHIFLKQIANERKYSRFSLPLLPRYESPPFPS